jgi:NADH-quinone oxidoreductase subunit A
MLATFALIDYLPILIFMGLVAGFGVVILALSDWLGRRFPGRRKGQAYECGMDPEGDARARVSIHFYLIAVLFILFDIETVFLIPWAVVAGAAGLPGLVEVLTFVAVVAVGLVYVWKKGALEWQS